jgi:hypothetical protein
MVYKSSFSVLDGKITLKEPIDGNHQRIDHARVGNDQKRLELRRRSCT